MKLKDIKGDLGSIICSDITKGINGVIFDEIKKRAPELGFHDKFFFGNMDNFKKFLSGKPIGFKTHGYTDENAPIERFRIPDIQSWYCKEDIHPEETSFDIETETMHIEIDLVSEYKGWWKVIYSLKAKDNMMKRLSDIYDEKIVKGDEIAHFDMLGRKIKIGDIICYSTTINNNVYLGTVSKFNDCTMQMTDGTFVQYDINVLVVSDSIEGKDKKYEHK